MTAQAIRAGLLAIVAVTTSATPLDADQGQTAAISGTVVDDQEPARPLSRAIVTVSAPELPRSWSVVTDDKGTFSIAGLPSGRYTVKAEKPAYLTSAMGSKRPSRWGTPLALTAGTNVSNIVLRLWRGAVIAGRVTDGSGRPLRGAAVRAVRDGGVGDPSLPVYSNNNIGQGPPGTAAGGITTDDRGEYRIFGLEPGEYAVMVTAPFEIGGAVSPASDALIDGLLAQLRQGRRVAALPVAEAVASTALSHSPMFYPGTASADSAAVLKLSAGQEVNGIDIRVDRIPVAAVSGVVRTADGAPAVGAIVSLYRTANATRFASLRPSTISAAAGPDGSFIVAGVPPSAYRLVARYRPRGAPITTASGAATPQDWAWTDLNVTGQDIQGVALTVGPGITVSGTIAFDREDGSTMSRPDLSKTSFGIRSLVTNTTTYSFLDPDGTFTIHGAMPEAYQFVVGRNGLDPAWVIRSAMSNGKDLLDGPADLGLRTDVTLTLTNRHSELSGRLRTVAGAAVTDVFVIAFATDQSMWGTESRRVQAVRPGADGTFSLRDLPAGEYFLGALLDVDAGDWLRSGFLDSVAKAAVRVRVFEGQKSVQDLQIGR